MSFWISAKGESLPDTFFDVARKVYESDPNWPVEDEDVVRWMFSDKHPYGEAIEWSACGIEGKVRAGLFFDPNLLMDDVPAACFGYWEGVDDLEAHREVLKYAEDWARDRGAKKLYGPINFSTYHAYRIRTDGFLNQPPFPGECYNPEYYQGILKAQGYTVRETYLSYRPNDYALDAFEKVAPMVHAKLEAAGLKPMVLTPDYWLDNREKIFPIFQATWKDNLGYVPITYEVFHNVFDEKVTKKIDPHLSLVVHGGDDELAGYFVVFPDYGPLLAQGNPNRVRESAINYEEHFPLLENPRLLMKSGCVVPAFRSMGLFNMMAAVICSKASKFGYKKPIACTVRSDNPSQKLGDFLKQIEPRTVYTRQEYSLFVKDV